MRAKSQRNPEICKAYFRVSYKKFSPAPTNRNGAKDWVSKGHTTLSFKSPVAEPPHDVYDEQTRESHAQGGGRPQRGQSARAQSRRNIARSL